MTNREYVEKLRRAADLVDGETTDDDGEYVEGVGWLDALEQVFGQRVARNVRHDIEWHYESDGGRIYDGPGDDTAAYWLRYIADDLAAHEALVEAMARKRAEVTA